MTYIIGIDPGTSGAVAILSPEKDLVFDIPTKVTGKFKEIDCPALYRRLEPLTFDTEDSIFFIEKVHAMPQNGSIAGFSLGHSLGCLKGVISSLGFEYRLVTPQKWKKHFGLNKDKELSRATAIRLFPEMAQYLSRKKDSDRAEALLIARYGQEMLR